MRVGSLGNTYEICVRDNLDETRIAAEPERPSKWKMQTAAMQLLPENKRICACHRMMVESANGVKIRRDSERAWFSGVAVCGSVWICPVCARKVGETRRAEMQTAIDRCISQGGDVALITLTFSHAIYHRIQDLLPRLAEATRKLKAGRKWQALKAKYGIIGSVRALEVTYGRNGWHPHIHEIEFSNRPLTRAEHEQLKVEIFELWAAACAKAQLGLPSAEHGVDVRGASRAAQYVGKWGFASELTRGSSKLGWSGRTPWQLLEDYCNGDQLAGQLWAEFARTFVGRRQLFWSAGLREKLGLGELFSDEELAELEPDASDAVDVHTIDRYQWAMVCRLEVRAKVLRLAMGPLVELQRYLQTLRSKSSRASIAQGLSGVTKVKSAHFWQTHLDLGKDVEHRSISNPPLTAVILPDGTRIEYSKIKKSAEVENVAR
jgi:hypothetical protein